MMYAQVKNNLGKIGSNVEIKVGTPAFSNH